ncbi:embryonic polarity protein dorsal isoform X2 [Folsomia candida]|uniref:embryonic polarity protein dorsal isoform X2 n=1 Tax=Folsomia candida TaxID=158441 RepID=UPI000B907D1A|nr:embryonic polarity protein dorsal isoform X2 [Folsomia candida]
MTHHGQQLHLPIVKILEEPAAKALRFRYECEGRSAGSLPGATSTHEKKTFPRIQVLPPTTQNSPHLHPPLTKGVVVVSCVTVEPPHRPHPHNLVGKEGCKKGVCTMELSTSESGEMITEFSNLGIQCVKKKDIEESLRVREEIRVDPFRTGFTHKTQPGSIDLNALRLCFQVFLEGPERGQFKIPLKPVVSEAIYDKKAINDLTIMKLSECTSPVLGNKEIIMLCDKVSKDDIEIRFYETTPTAPHTTLWEAFADFQPSDVHKQYAITFRTPAYRDLEITTPTTSTYIQLRCPSKDTTSLPRMFEFTPIASDLSDGLQQQTKRKRWVNNSQRIENHLLGAGAVNKFQTPPPPAPPPLLSPLLIPALPNIPPNFAYPQQQYYHQSSSSPQQQQQQQPIKQEYYDYYDDKPMLDFSNISLPNLSDVNLSLLESHLSENFSERLDLG